MANAATITINDGQATPVAVAFQPESVTSTEATFADRTSGIALGFRRLSVSNKIAKGTSKVNRAKYAIEYPVTTSVNGITTVAYTLRATVDVILPDASTALERNNLYAFVKNGLANTLVQGALRDIDPLW
jgi:hypothetical protein